MNTRIITETFRAMNNGNENYYYSDHNRKWQPLTATLNPWIPGEISVIPFLMNLAIMDKEGNINPVIAKAGLFACITICNPEIGLEVSIKEILVSNLGLEFLKSMNEKRFLLEGDYCNA